MSGRSPHMSDRDIIWRPTPERIERARITKFMRQHGLASLDELLRRSVADPEWYWDAVSRDLGFRWMKPYTRVLDTSRGIAWPRWFEGGLMNLSDNCVDRHVDEGRGEQAGHRLGSGRRRGPHAGPIASCARRQSPRQCPHAAWSRAGGLGRALPAHVRGGGHRAHGHLPHRRHLLAVLLRLRRPGGGGPARRLRAPRCSSPPTASRAAARPSG